MLVSFRRSLVVLVLALAACTPGGADGTPQPATEVPGSTSVAPSETTATLAPEGEAAQATPFPTSDGPPPQTNMAAVEPADRREELTRLSKLIDFQLTGLDGAAFGPIRDYVINTCETYIVYMVVEPEASLNLAAGSRALVPYEAVTINSGIVNAETRSIGLYLGPGALAAAPLVTDPLTLYPIEWEQPVRDYWGEAVRVGKLSSACQAGGRSPENALHKIAYASELMGAELKDGLGNVLGTVTEAILAPETGKLAFYVVELTDSQGLTLVPIGKTNLPEEVEQPGATVELVLLADNAQLAGAPKLESAEAASKDDSLNSARAYWGQ